MVVRNRRISLPAHGTVDFFSGIVLMLAPAALHLGTAALVLSAPLGAVLAGVGLGLASDTDRAFGWHRHFDAVFIVAAAVAALGLAVAGSAGAAFFLAAIVALQAWLNSTTSYATT